MDFERVSFDCVHVSGKQLPGGLYLAYVSPLSAREMKTNEMKCYSPPSLKSVCMRLLSDAREMRVGQQLMWSLDLNMMI